MVSQTFTALPTESLLEMIREIVEECLQSHRDALQPVSKSPPDIQMVTRKKALTMLSITSPTLREMEKRGELRPTRIGRKVVFRRDEIEKFLSTH